MKKSKKTHNEICKACKFGVVLGGKVKCLKVIQEKICNTFTRKTT